MYLRSILQTQPPIEDENCSSLENSSTKWYETWLEENILEHLSYSAESSSHIFCHRIVVYARMKILNIKRKIETIVSSDGRMNSFFRYTVNIHENFRTHKMTMLFRRNQVLDPIIFCCSSLC